MLNESEGFASGRRRDRHRLAKRMARTLGGCLLLCACLLSAGATAAAAAPRTDSDAAADSALPADSVVQEVVRMLVYH
ncbi:MAG TPA: hypothetical protein VHR45_24865 [Thermoanaerobaculia bacterium]|nr:hypothetical protein [Thermoanaerobaculia bacterium]